MRCTVAAGGTGCLDRLGIYGLRAWHRSRADEAGLAAARVAAGSEGARAGACLSSAGRGCCGLFVRRVVAALRASRGDAGRFCFSSPLVPDRHPRLARSPRDPQSLLTRLSSLLHSFQSSPTMYSTLLSVALFSSLAIQGALADFTVNTPEITQVRPSSPVTEGHSLTRPSPTFSASLSSSPGPAPARRPTTSPSSPARTPATM